MLYLTKRVEFSASHRLHNPELNDAENYDIFDKCNNYYGHGHNYILEVTVAGEPDEKSNYVMDLKKLKKLIEDEILIKVDHKHLNYDVDFLKNIIPTVENIIIKFWEILEDKMPSKVVLNRLRLYETPNSWIDYFGNKNK